MTVEPTRFADLAGVHPRTVEALERKGMTHAFPVQAAVIPVAHTGQDVLVQSPTGSGKTLAFGLPIIGKLEKGMMRPGALILVPTRELAVQVTEDLEGIATGKQLRVTAVYGGAPIHKQVQAVRTAAIVVATPGRLDDLIRNRKIDLRGVEVLVLDEADRMLDMGFQPQVDAIVDMLKGPRQTMLFSATLEGKVAKVAATYTTDAEVIRTTLPPGAGGKIEHVMWATTGGTKVDTILESLETERDLSVIFVRTQRGADTLVGRLREHGLKATAIHGGMSQRERLNEYRRFQNASCDVLVATDVFARGMDLDRITHVINYDIPEDADTYRHRSGRTGRAGRTGIAITLVTPAQRKQMRRMVREAGIPLEVFDNPRRTKRTGREALPLDQQYVIPSRSNKPIRAGGKPTWERGHKHGERAGSGDRSPARGNQRFGNKGGKPATGGPRGGAPVPTGGPGDGSVLSYDPAKGFGFIAPDNGGPDVFFHRAAIGEADQSEFQRGTRVAFGTQEHDRGMRAKNVKPFASDRS